MGKNKFRFKTLTVRDALKKGLQPYKDFYPLKGPPKNKKNSKPDNRSLAEMMQEDSPLKSWADLGNVAKDLYDTPGEALDVLARESIKVPKTNPKTLMMCELLERVRKDKKNKDKKFNKIIDEHLEQCCTFMDVDYSLVDIPKSEMIKGSTYNKKKKYSRQDIIDRIVTRHGNLVIKQPGKFKDWLNTHSHTVRKLLK
ncbi:hypothetical protein N8869_00635 [Candidatus Pelagibacter sp.]|nr:hypothetical protein [Candidatus Pelagibacter sp.]